MIFSFKHVTALTFFHHLYSQGIPYAPYMDPWVILKKQYLDEKCAGGSGAASMTAAGAALAASESHVTGMDSAGVVLNPSAFSRSVAPSAYAAVSDKHKQIQQNGVGVSGGAQFLSAQQLLQRQAASATANSGLHVSIGAGGVNANAYAYGNGNASTNVNALAYGGGSYPVSNNSATAPPSLPPPPQQQQQVSNAQKPTHTLNGQAWYVQSAGRAVNQVCNLPCMFYIRSTFLDLRLVSISRDSFVCILIAVYW
jgi:hypothetical protein